MNLTVNEPEYCKVAVSVEADAEHVNSARAEVLSEFRELPMPGFRAGKAPIEAVKMRFKAQIENRLRQRLVESAYSKLLSDKQVKPFGYPQFSAVELTDSRFSCEFTLNTQPTFELGEYKAFSLPKPSGLPTEDEFTETLLQELRNRNGETLPFAEDEFVQRGDAVIIDYEASIDGVSRPELTAQKEVITVGTSPVAAFDDNLLGMKMGETREFGVTGPENGAESYRGKTIQFKVTLVMGSKTRPAPLDDSLAVRLGFETLEALRAHLQGLAASRVAQHHKVALSSQVSARLVENHTFQVPEWLVVAEAKVHARRAGAEWDTVPDDRKEEFLKSAEKSIKLSLVLEKVRESEPEAQLTDEEVHAFLRTQLAQLANKAATDVESQIQRLAKEGTLPILVAKIRDEHTLSFLVDSCTVIE